MHYDDHQQYISLEPIYWNIFVGSPSTFFFALAFSNDLRLHMNKVLCLRRQIQLTQIYQLVNMLTDMISETLTPHSSKLK